MSKFRLSLFRSGESGAVTQDWVVLTAAVAGFGVAVLAVLRGGYAETSSEIGTFIEEQSVSTGF